MKIDCRNLSCPEPVIKTKNCLANLKEPYLEVILNSVSSVANVTRFAINQGYKVEKVQSENNDVILKIYKDSDTNEIIGENSNKNNFLNKTLFIKDDKIGEGEFGHQLIKWFLKTLLEFDNLPKNIIFVNKGVFITTGEDVEALKKLERRGVNIFSCGLCLDYYNIPYSKLKVGEIGNAYDTVNMLLTTETVSL